MPLRTFLLSLWPRSARQGSRRCYSPHALRRIARVVAEGTGCRNIFAVASR